MKYSVILLFALFSFFSQAQSYYPFPVSYGMWSNQILDNFWQPTNEYRTYRLEGDTLINIHTYKKIYMGEYHGGLREENKIVYYLPADSLNEQLLYNFNLNVGDSLFNSYTEYGILNEIDTLSVFGIDSVLCEDGNYHKQFRIGYPGTMGNGGEYIIEGIGSIHGLLTPMYVGSVSGGPRLNCTYGDNGMVYQLSGAFCYTEAAENTVEKNVHLYPNPASTYFAINSIKPITSIRIYSLIGVLVKSEMYTNIIDINDLLNGLYCIEIQTTESITTQKLLVSK